MYIHPTLAPIHVFRRRRYDVDTPGSMTLDISLGIVGIVAVIAVTARSAGIWRRPHRPSEAARPPKALSEIDATLARLEISLDAIAIEVERIGENQRFLTRTLAERARPSDPP